MRGNIISYIDMCQREGTSLQKGMNFRLKGKHSVILMSVRKNSPYQDEITEDGTVLIYEGHDIPRSLGVIPKNVDQPSITSAGNPTENGKFHDAAQKFQKKIKAPEVVQVYEKIKAGIWSDNGFFHLVDSWTELQGDRKVFKFKLIAVEKEYEPSVIEDSDSEVVSRSRIIPSSVKLEVWKRDGGCCVTCGAEDELHFDHVLPFSKGGTSLKAENVQLLCARHNLQKSAKIQ